MSSSFRRLFVLIAFALLLATGLHATPSFAKGSGPVCEQDPDCRKACRVEAQQTRAECLAAGQSYEACQERSKAHFRACAASRCSPILVCEERCRVHSAGLLRACLAQGAPVEVCQRQADDSAASCVAQCEPCPCPDVWAPVCGADGNTYGNACEARCAHVEIAQPGVCEPPCPPFECPLDCESGFQQDDGCPVCECREPCSCPEIYAPVCGADGRTYGNACEARCAQAEILHEGDCASDCQGNGDCAAGDVCYPPSGVCQPACEIVCIQPDPVCGSDGATYACGPEDAFCHGVEVLHEGECVPRCFGDQDCAPGARCNAADICLPPLGCTPGIDCPALCTGICVDCPCPDIYDPVCGSDGVTHDNDCRATCRGAEIVHPGACD